MYVDESGLSNFKDSNKYYVLSGVIVENTKIKEIKKRIFDYKHANFVDTYIESEIQAHSIFQRKKNFLNIPFDIRVELLDKLYILISELPITSISVAIDKKCLQDSHPNWKVFKIAWTVLVSRFNNYLAEMKIDYEQTEGFIKIDKTAGEERTNIVEIFNEMRNHKKPHQRIDNIIGDPLFVNSDAIEGIQIADSIAYCTTKYLDGKVKFGSYWHLIKDRIYSKNDKIIGYGLIVYPK